MLQDYGSHGSTGALAGPSGHLHKPYHWLCSDCVAGIDAIDELLELDKDTGKCSDLDHHAHGR